MALAAIHWRLRLFVRRNPALFLPLVAFSKRPYDGSFRRISGQTDILIDAYPRCANTFATFAFLAAQTEKVSLAHHFHAPAAIKAAAARRIPVLTIIRDPKDAVSSALMYAGSKNVRRGLEEYIDYYESVQQCRTELLVARFESVVADFGSVTTALNRRYGTCFGVFKPTAESKLAVEREIRNANEKVWKARGSTAAERVDQLTLPVEERLQTKQALVQNMERPAMTVHLRHATAIHDRLHAGADI